MTPSNHPQRRSHTTAGFPGDPWPSAKFHSVVAELASEDPDRAVAIFEGSKELTLRELVERGEATARQLRGLGVSPGDRVVLMMGNRSEYLFGWYACSRLGVVRVPVNVEARGIFLSQTLHTARPTVIIAADTCAEQIGASDLDEAMTTVLLLPSDEVADAVEFRYARLADLAESSIDDISPADPSDTSVIQFTSGTTGPSKGAMMTHKYEHLMASLIADFLELGERDTYLMYNPLFHVHAQTTFFATLMAGGRMAFPARFSASRWREDLTTYEATVSSMLGVMLAFVLDTSNGADEAENQLRCLWTVPAPIDSVNALRRRFGIERVVTSYGNTEVGMIAAGEVDADHPGTAGKPFTEHYDVAVMDPHTDVVLGPDEVGECVVRPRHPWIVAQGYFESADATLRAFRNLWFHTGDAVTMDAEGRLRFVDRLNDRIRRRGENLASADLEAAIHEHPDVEEVAVAAVPSQLAGGEDEILVCLNLRDDQDEDVQSWARAFSAWLEKALPRYAQPRYLDFYESLPKTSTEKVAKYRLRERSSARASIDLNEVR